MAIVLKIVQSVIVKKVFIAIAKIYAESTETNVDDELVSTIEQAIL